MSFEIRLRDLVFLSVISALALGWYFNNCFEAQLRASIVRQQSDDALQIESLTQMINNLIAGDADAAPSLAALQLLQIQRRDLKNSL